MVFCFALVLAQPHPTQDARTTTADTASKKSSINAKTDTVSKLPAGPSLTTAAPDTSANPANTASGTPQLNAGNARDAGQKLQSAGQNNQAGNVKPVITAPGLPKLSH